MLHETIIATIKDTFLGHLSNEEVQDERATNMAAYTVAYLEDHNMEVTPENISKNADNIISYMKNDGQANVAANVAVPALSLEERLVKLEKSNKMVTSFCWIFMAVAFLYVFVVQPGSKSA